jgi:hypothetical protein
MAWLRRSARHRQADHLVPAGQGGGQVEPFDDPDPRIEEDAVDGGAVGVVAADGQVVDAGRRDPGGGEVGGRRLVSATKGSVALSDPMIIGRKIYRRRVLDGHQMPDSACLTGLVPTPDRKICGAMIM